MSEVVAAPVVAPAAATTEPATPAAVSAAAVLAPPAAVAALVAEPPKLTVPGKDAKPEDWKAFYRSIGAPEKTDDYKIDYTGYSPIDKRLGESMAQKALDAGLRPDQANSLFSAYRAEQQKILQEQDVARSEAAKRDESALTNEWGAEHAKNMEMSKRAAVEFIQPFAGEKTSAAIDALERTIGFKATMQIMHAMGQKIGSAAPRGLGEQPRNVGDGLYESMKARFAANPAYQQPK